MEIGPLVTHTDLSTKPYIIGYVLAVEKPWKSWNVLHLSYADWKLFLLTKLKVAKLMP